MRADPSGATRTGLDHALEGPALVDTYTREGASLVHGVERSNEKYCLPLRSIATAGSEEHAA